MPWDFVKFKYIFCLVATVHERQSPWSVFPSPKVKMPGKVLIKYMCEVGPWIISPTDAHSLRLVSE